MHAGFLNSVDEPRTPRPGRRSMRFKVSTYIVTTRAHSGIGIDEMANLVFAEATLLYFSSFSRRDTICLISMLFPFRDDIFFSIIIYARIPI